MKSSLVLTKAAVVTSLALCIPACAAPTEGDDAPEDTNLGSSADELSILGTVGWGGTTPLNIGSASNRTCFLTGVHGELWGTDNYGNNDEASVKVFISGGSWFIQADPGNGAGIIGHATCIPTSAAVNATRTFHGVSALKPNVSETFHTRGPNEQCFITELAGTSGWAAWNTSAARTTRTTRWIGGVLTPVWLNTLNVGDQAHPGKVYARMSTVCFDLAVNATHHGQLTGATANTSLPNAACGLTGVAGNFRDAPLSTGVEVFPNSSGTWTMTASPGETIWIDCHQ
ncbi:MAG: hypothetical protein KF850_13635 [Labilithrix sp.]|nr:hypothetical protein [Labilithrix sp.]